MINPYMSNYEELRSYAKNYNITESDAMKSSLKVRKEKDNVTLSLEPEVYDTSTGKPVLKINNNIVDTGVESACTKLNDEDVTVIKETTREKKKKKVLSDIEKWLNTTIFENGKYTKMDTKTVVSLAKYMFDLGYNFRDTGKFNLK